MKRRTKLILILSAVAIVVIVFLVMHLRVRSQFTDYLLQRYPSENFSIDFVSYRLFPRRAVAQTRTASDGMLFDVTGAFDGLSLEMDISDNYYASRSRVYFRDRLDPVIEDFGDDVHAYALTIRDDMAPVQTDTIPIYPFELHIMLGEDITRAADFVDRVANLAERLDRQNVAVMEILHFVSVPVRPEESALEPFGLDRALLQPNPTPTPEVTGETEATDVETSETEVIEPLTEVPKTYRVTTDMMFEVFLDRGDRPYTAGIVQNGMRIVPVNRSRLQDLGIEDIPTVEVPTTSQSTRRTR